MNVAAADSGDGAGDGAASRAKTGVAQPSTSKSAVTRPTRISGDVDRVLQQRKDGSMRRFTSRVDEHQGLAFLHAFSHFL